jgi:type I restriction enzyme S subunit
MSEWKEYKLGDISEFWYGKMPKKELLGKGEYVTFSGYRYQDAYPEYNCNEGDVILVARGVGGTGDVKIVKQQCYLTNLSIKLLLDNTIIDNKFFYYFFKKDNLRYLDSGSAQSQITITDLNNEIFVFPSLDEQKAIASVLCSLDDKIDLLHRQNVTLEKMAETLFRQWFVEEAKEEWEETNLECHVEVLRGLSYKGDGLTECRLGLPMHNLNSVYEGGGYKYDGIKYYSGEYKEKHFINPGDIIVTNTEQGHEFKLIGFPAIVPNLFGKRGLFSQHIYKLILKNETYLSNEFIYYLLMFSSVREQIISATNGSTVNMLAIDGLQRPEFKLPPIELVKKFDDVISAYWKKKETNQSQIRTLAQLRDTLLPKLMSREVRVDIDLKTIK